MSKRKIYEEINGISLTKRQWETYKLIKRNSAFGIRTTQEELVYNYSKYGYENGIKVVVREDGYEWYDDPSYHDKCAAVWKDINEINMRTKDIVISPTPYEYKIAETYEEVESYARELYLLPAVAKLARYWNMIHKINKSGQGELVFDEQGTINFLKDYMKGGVVCE